MVRSKKWYKQRLNVLSRLKRDDVILKNRIEKQINMHNEQIRKMRKRLEKIK